MLVYLHIPNKKNNKIKYFEVSPNKIFILFNIQNIEIYQNNNQITHTY